MIDILRFVYNFFAEVGVELIYSLAAFWGVVFAFAIAIRLIKRV